MNAEQLLAHYERIAEAPDAIARLRQFVLNLAVRGKLVERNPGDVPASEIIERLQERKFEKSGRGLANAVKTPRDALPFSPPNHWHWAKLVSFSRASYGFAFASGRFNSNKVGMPLIRIRDISRLETEAYFDGEYDPFYLVRAGDYLVGMDGDFNLRRWGGKDALLNQRVLRLNNWQGEIDPEYVRIPLQMVLDFLHGNTSQTTVKHLSAKQVNGIEIPLPPIAEQDRIVAKVDELMTLCDRLEEARKEREAARDRLTAASLARLNAPDPDPATFTTHVRFVLDTFPALTTRCDQIKQLRQTILDLAVRGKLVEQSAEDVPAGELLRVIASDKGELIKRRTLRRERPLPSIQITDCPFQIPANWAWARLGDMCQFVTSGSRDWAKHYSDDGAVFVRMGNLSKGNYHLRLSNIQHVNPPASGEGTRTKLEGGDILISITGDVGMLGLVPDEFGEAYINQHVAMVRPMPTMKGRYLAELFRSPFAQNQFDEPQRGIKNSFRLTDVTHFLTPVPPLSEQQRIVAKVDELMSLCDRLEASLATGDETRQRLLEAVLREALEPAEARELEPA